MLFYVCLSSSSNNSMNVSDFSEVLSKKLMFHIRKYDHNCDCNEDFTRKLQFVITKGSYNFQLQKYYACSQLATVQLIYNLKHVWLYMPGNCVESWHFFVQEITIACMVLETLKGTSHFYTCTKVLIHCITTYCVHTYAHSPLQHSTSGPGKADR